MRRLLALLFILLTGCPAQHSGSPGEESQASNSLASAEALQSFQTTVYAFGQTQGCVKCHSVSVNPRWMNGDLISAYSYARPFLNLDDAANSLFAVYATNGHCNDAICSDQNNAPIIQDLLLQWATVEHSQESGGLPPGAGLTLTSPPYVTMSMPVPSVVPLITSNTPAIIRFNLSQLSPPVPKLNGAILEVSIQYYNAAQTTYKIFNPRLVGNASPVTLAGLHAYARPVSGSGLGTEDSAQGLAWSQITVTAAPTALPAPLPTGPMTAIIPLVKTSLGVATQSSADVITIGFAQLN